MVSWPRAGLNKYTLSPSTVIWRPIGLCFSSCLVSTVCIWKGHRRNCSSRGVFPYSFHGCKTWIVWVMQRGWKAISKNDCILKCSVTLVSKKTTTKETRRKHMKSGLLRFSCCWHSFHGEWWSFPGCNFCDWTIFLSSWSPFHESYWIELLQHFEPTDYYHPVLLNSTKIHLDL